MIRRKGKGMVELVKESPEEIRTRFALKNGWFVPEIHSKYLELELQE